MAIVENEDLSDAVREAQMTSVGAEVVRESERIEAMSYHELVADKRQWLRAGALHPTEGQRWGADWHPQVAAALIDRPVRKKYQLGNIHAVNFGRVVGCDDHSFYQVRELHGAERS